MTLQSCRESNFRITLKNGTLFGDYSAAKPQTTRSNFCVQCNKYSTIYCRYLCCSVVYFVLWMKCV